MADETISDKAKTAVEKTLDSGQSFTLGDMSVSQPAVAASHDVYKDELDRAARKSGRRPLFRGINLSGVA